MAKQNAECPFYYLVRLHPHFGFMFMRCDLVFTHAAIDSDLVFTHAAIDSDLVFTHAAIDSDLVFTHAAIDSDLVFIHAAIDSKANPRTSSQTIPWNHAEEQAMMPGHWMGGWFWYECM